MSAIRLLLVEDNEADAYLARETLASSALAPRIAEVRDGAAALDYLFRRPPYEGEPRPDLVLLDLNLPRLDGQQVLAAMRANAGLRLLPVVVLSSSDAEGDIRRCYGDGANCYVTKPIGFDAFQAALRSIETFWLSVARLP